MTRVEKIENTLSRHGYKTTAVRKKVYFALADAPYPMSNSELIKHTKDVDKVSVYRTLALFETIGVVHRIWNGFKSKIELSEDFSPHHHHFTCTSCNMMVSFKNDEIEQALNALSKAMHVRIEQHLVELSGTCNQCQ